MKKVFILVIVVGFLLGAALAVGYYFGYEDGYKEGSEYYLSFNLGTGFINEMFKKYESWVYEEIECRSDNKSYCKLVNRKCSNPDSDICRRVTFDDYSNFLNKQFGTLLTMNSRLSKYRFKYGILFGIRVYEK